MPPAAPPPARTVEHSLVFSFRSGTALEPNCAVADVRGDRAEIWGSFKSPILCKQQAAALLGLDPAAVAVHVVEGGGSFGRHCFRDAALEAVEASKAFNKPVRLMWHRSDDIRHGRMHPMSISRVRATLLGAGVIDFEHRLTGVVTDFRHGFGEAFSATVSQPPAGELVFPPWVNVPYSYGRMRQQLTEVYDVDTFATGPVCAVYVPAVCTAVELMTDQIAQALGRDCYEFRRQFCPDARLRAVLDEVARAGRWGRAMAPGTAQGIAILADYKTRVATLVECDVREQEPRVTSLVLAVDVGLVVNPLGLEAQMTGGAMDGIVQALTAGLHVSDGLPLENSWDTYRYARQRDTPRRFRVIVMPSTTDVPTGAGEVAVGAVQAAVACALARATGRIPVRFPVAFDGPLGFVPAPTVPPIPQSPTDGLRRTR